MSFKPLNLPQQVTGAPPPFQAGTGQFPVANAFPNNNNPAPYPNPTQFGTQLNQQQNKVLTTEFRQTANNQQGFPGAQPVKQEQPDNSQYVNELKLTVQNQQERMKKKEEHYSRQLR